MRTTVDLPPGLLERVRSTAAETGQSVSATISGLLARGLDSVESRPAFDRSAVTGLPVISTGRPITAREVADLVDEDE